MKTLISQLQYIFFYWVLMFYFTLSMFIFMTIVEVAFISGKLPNHLKHYKKPENITELRKLKKKWE